MRRSTRTCPQDTADRLAPAIVKPSSGARCRGQVLGPCVSGPKATGASGLSHALDHGMQARMRYIDLNAITARLRRRRSGSPSSGGPLPKAELAGPGDKDVRP